MIAFLLQRKERKGKERNGKMNVQEAYRLISKLGDEHKGCDFSFKDGAIRIVKHSTRLEVIASEIMNQIEAEIKGFYTGRIPCMIGDQIVQPAKSFVPKKCAGRIFMIQDNLAVHRPTFVLEVVDDSQSDADLKTKLALWVSEQSSCNIALGVNIGTGKCFLTTKFLGCIVGDLNSKATDGGNDYLTMPMNMFYDRFTTERPFILRLQPIRDIIEESICFS